MSNTEPKKLFDHLKQITEVQNPNYFDSLDDASKKSFSNFMVHRFISMNPEWLDLISELQPYTELLDAKSLYLAYIGLLPKGKTYLKYVKGKKDNDKYEDWLLELIVRYYECSVRVAKEYLYMLYQTQEGRENIKDICEKYGVAPEKIKKLKLKL